ncbi:MAG: S-methyl-5'-thioadenosine phosphorylase [Chloroflexi bacterium]|jgi:5'-methylthioadenosine phosphorylase|nr:S-methyl-5'-thioadenosine phosphorylase [Chloroflexota bacterium]MBT4004307.1 S-methyl-5'-thioadenosine phosphorylase [Chloroflexota bacterium]MBT4305775.1 S-methyl-5'-thioadenosine phosphorylase [Chloroflexota bacterium]MBT4533599.1 S-methyl-5'-thioadenosine phosphorylase [Chloroflexota bacterium]MBT4681758.1 S-methyl-5'-thioadenosine phosphorylase [Chloroflexota bacterium]
MNGHPLIGIIGGSGLYGMEGLENIEKHEIQTPFGEPSSPIIVGGLEGKRVAFLARHGIGHTISPTNVNYRANIYAMKTMGVKFILSVSACGSLREDYAPGDIVVPDQLFDLTKNRKRSFFDKELVVHVDVADPFCTDFSNQILDAVGKTSATVHEGGTFITIEGPRFSTRGESNTYRSWGMSIIGMTTSPEAFLAREAEICYGVLAHVTDYDVWHVTEEPVTVQQVIQTISGNTKIADEAIRNLVSAIDVSKDCQHQNALADALITNPNRVPPELVKNLDLLIGKYFK